MKDHNIRQIVSQISKTMILLKKEIISLKKDKKYLIKRVNNLEHKLNNVKKINNKNHQINNTNPPSTNDTKLSSTNEIDINDKIKIVINSNKVNKQTLEEIIFELKKIDEDGNIFTITKLECPDDEDQEDKKGDYFYNFYLGDTLINATDRLFTYEKYE